MQADKTRDDESRTDYSRNLVRYGGHQFGLHLAAGLDFIGNEAYPLVFEPSGKFAPAMTLDDGRVALTDEPGIGSRVKLRLSFIYQ